jgi:hypothetical protein
MKMKAFWNIAPCSLVEVGSTSTRLHGAMSQKAVIFVKGKDYFGYIHVDGRIIFSLNVFKDRRV